MIDGRLHFGARADELAALHPRAEVDPQGIFDYLSFQVIPPAAHQLPRRLPPAAGHAGALALQPYWQPHFTEPTSADFAARATRF